MKSLLLLISCLLLPFITPLDPIARLIADGRHCSYWFPEPITFKTEIYNANLTKEYQVIEDFVADRNVKETREIVEKYVIETLNGEGSGGYFDVFRIVFNQLPTVRLLTISIFCLITSLILFSIIWRLGLDELLEYLGIKLQIHRYRVGMSIVPIFCCIGLLLLTSNLSTSVSFILQGLNDLETGNDRNFMPIKERIKNKLGTIECSFKRDFGRSIMDKGMVIEKYLESIDSMPFGKNLSNIPVPTNMTESWCIALDKAAYETARNLRAATTFKKLENNVTILLFSYLTIIENQLNTTIPIYEKALGGIEEFVERYHRMILFIPSTGIINLYQSIIVGMVGVAVFVTISLTVLMIIEYEFMRKWIQKTILASVFLINFFAVFSLLLFLALIYRICFIEVVHWQSQQNQFETLRKVDPTNLVENGHNYSINYGLILQKSLKERRTLFNLLTDKEIPDCINVEKVFKPNGVYNETVRSLSRITVDEYGNWVNSSCEAATRASDILLRKLMTKCSYSVDIHQRSIDKSKVFETAYSKWTETISSYAWKAITERASATDERSPIQMYMVFENPSKKLRPTVLEHLFRMAFLILRIVPIYVVLSVFLMCIIPLLMSDEVAKTTAKTEFSKSSSDEKSLRSDPKV